MLAALFFYEFTRSELILLILTCVMVMTLEIINTAIEVLTDKASPEYSTLAKVAKDTAAGAVLVASIAAIVIGVILFWNIERLSEIVALLLSNLFMGIAFLISLLLSGIFIFTGKERRRRGGIHSPARNEKKP